MANQHTIDKIARSISFEVEAIPQDNTIQLTSTANTTPLNVRIKVRKKQDAGAAQNAVISIPKLDSPGAAPERVRLVSSDQTIMSFNVFMENEEGDKAPRKVKKGFFDFFKSGTHSEVEHRSRSKSPTPQKKHDSVSRVADEMCSEPSMRTENISNKSSHAERKAIKKGILGKYKPGGCLDPPFGEDKYAYEKKILTAPVQSMPAAVSYSEDLKIVGENPTYMYKTNVHGKKIKDNVDDGINMQQQFKDIDSSTHTSLLQEENYTVTESFSNFLITYPPSVTVSEQKIHDRINEKNMKNKISNAENNYRSSVQSSAEIYYCRSDRKSSTRSTNEKSKQDSTVGAGRALINTSSSTGDDKLLATKTMTCLETNHAAIPSSIRQLKLKGQPLFPSQSSNQLTDFFQTIVEELVTQGKITPVSDSQRYLRSARIKHKDSENKYKFGSQISSLSGNTMKTTDMFYDINNKSELLAKSKLSCEITDKLAAYRNEEESLKSSIKNQPFLSDDTFLNPSGMETQPYYIVEKMTSLKHPAEENLVLTGSNSSVKSKPTYIDYREPFSSELIESASTIASEPSSEMKATNVDDSIIISNEMSSGIPLLVSSNTCSKNHPIYFDNESNIDSLAKSHEPKLDALIISMNGQASCTDDSDLISNELTTKFLPDPLVHLRAELSPKLLATCKTSHVEASDSKVIANIPIISPKITAKNKADYIDKSLVVQNDMKTEIVMPTGVTLTTSTKSQFCYADNATCKERNFNIKSYSSKDFSIKSSLSHHYLTKNFNEFNDETPAEILLTQDISVKTTIDNAPFFSNNNQFTASNTTAKNATSKSSTKTNYIYQDDKETDLKNEIQGKVTTTVLNELATKSHTDTDDVLKQFLAKVKPNRTDCSGTIITNMQPDTPINRIVSSEISLKNRSEKKSIQNYRISKYHLSQNHKSSKTQLRDTNDSFKLCVTKKDPDIISAETGRTTEDINIENRIDSSKISANYKSSYESILRQLIEDTLLTSNLTSKSNFSGSSGNEILQSEIHDVSAYSSEAVAEKSIVDEIMTANIPITKDVLQKISAKNKLSSFDDNNQNRNELNLQTRGSSSDILKKSALVYSEVNETIHDEISEFPFTGKIVAKTLRTKPSSNFDKGLISVEIIGSTVLPILTNPEDNEIVEEDNEISPNTANTKPSYASGSETIIPIRSNKQTHPSFDVSSKLSGKTTPYYGIEPISGEIPIISSKTSITIQPIHPYDNDAVQYKETIFTPAGISIKTECLPFIADDDKSIQMNTEKPYIKSKPSYTEDNKFISHSRIASLNLGEKDEYSAKIKLITEASVNRDVSSEVAPENEASHMNAIESALSKLTTETFSSHEDEEDSNSISIELMAEGTLSKASAKRLRSYDKSSDTNNVKTSSLSSKTSNKSKPSYASYRESNDDTKRNENSDRIKLIQGTKKDSSKSSTKRLFSYADARDSIQNKLMALVSSKNAEKNKLSNAGNRKSILENLISMTHLHGKDDTARGRYKESAKEFGKSQAGFSNINKSIVDRLPQSRELFSFDLSVERTLESKNKVEKGSSISTPSLHSRELIESDVKEVQQHKDSKMYIVDSQTNGSIIELKKEAQYAYVGSTASTNTKIEKNIFEPNMLANIISNSDTPKYLTHAIKPPVEPLIILGQESDLSKDNTIPSLLGKIDDTLKFKQSQLLLEPEISLLKSNFDDGVSGSSKTFELVHDDLENSIELMHGSYKMLSNISKSVLDDHEYDKVIASNTPIVFSPSESKKNGSYKLKDATTSQFSEDSENKKILKTDTQTISFVSIRESVNSFVKDGVKSKIKPQIPNIELTQGIMEDNTTGTKNFEELFQSRDSLKSPLLLHKLKTDGEDSEILCQYDFLLEKSKENHSEVIKNKDIEKKLPTTIHALSEKETSRKDILKDTSPFSQPASVIITESAKSLNLSSISNVITDPVESLTISTNGNNIKTQSEILGTDTKRKPENKLKIEVLKSSSDPFLDKVYYKQVTELENNGKISEPFEFQMKNLERVSRAISRDAPNQTLKISAAKIDNFYSKQVSPLQSTNFLSSLRKPEDSNTSLLFNEDDRRSKLESVYKIKSGDKDDNWLKPVENNKIIAQSYTSLSATSIYLTDKGEDLQKEFEDPSHVYNNARYANSISQSDMDTYFPILKLQDTMKDKSIENKKYPFKTPEIRENMKIKSGSVLSPSNFNISMRGDNNKKPFDHESQRSVEINQHNHNLAATPLSYYSNGVTQQAGKSLSSTKIQLDYVNSKIMAQQTEQRAKIPKDEKLVFSEDESPNLDDLNISEIDKSLLKLSIPHSLTYMKENLEREKDVSESGVVVIDVSFQSYLNSRSERVIKSFNSGEPKHHQDNTISTFRFALRPSDPSINIAIDSSTDLTIGINRRGLVLRESNEKYNMMSNNEIQSHIYKDHAEIKPTLIPSKSTAGDTKQMDKLQRVLSTVYNNHMVPLQDIIHQLKDDIDALATQQELFRQKIMINKKSKSTRISHTVKRCGCLRK